MRSRSRASALTEFVFLAPVLLLLLLGLVGIGVEVWARNAARNNPRSPASLDPNLAWTAAADYVAAQPPGLSAIINANPGQVSVEVTSSAVPVIFVRGIGFTSPIHVRATAIAEPRTGIVSATP